MQGCLTNTPLIVSRAIGRRGAGEVRDANADAHEAAGTNSSMMLMMTERHSRGVGCVTMACMACFLPSSGCLAEGWKNWVGWGIRDSEQRTVSA